jgi:hypothetical protein
VIIARRMGSRNAEIGSNTTRRKESVGPVARLDQRSRIQIARDDPGT